MAPIGNAVYATLLVNDAYLPGAMVLGHSLRDRGAKAKLVALVVLNKVAATTIADLKTVYDDIVPVPQVVNPSPHNLYLMGRPDLFSTFTKIELWRQLQYDRIVYIDADVVALRAPNELLTMDTKFAAVPDIGWPDCFNSGVMVLNPNKADYYALLALAERGISFDGGDQGLLNMHFTDWERLSFKYNCTPSGNYQYVPAYRHFQSTINLVHFIGREKPWKLGRDSRHSEGVYGELLGRWWAVYDGHYRAKEIVYYSGNWQEAPKRVQDYVKGEETTYLPAYQAPPPGLQSFSTEQVAAEQRQQNQQYHQNQNHQQNSHGQQHQPPPPPSGVSQSHYAETSYTAEQPMGDTPSVAEQIGEPNYEPTPTVEQRRWSAPHAEWEPARAPPPVHSKPEASNFPNQTYDFSSDVKLFEPPAKYPDAPKDMWYQVPEKVTPPEKPKPIFPWEENAPKPTRVFLEPKPPSPPPILSAPEPSIEPEKRPEPEGPIEATTAQPPTTDQTHVSGTSVETPQAPYVDPWTTFNLRTNAWDDMPEITRYVQALHPPRRAKIQVLHHTPSNSIGGFGDVASPFLPKERRLSVKITDFPTAVERPSLPVTPAPIRRPSFWGENEEQDMSGELPTAEGVPRQEEWVRRFSSYPTPAFASLTSLMHEHNGILSFTCQHCGKQNPVAKLEELQRLQSEALLGKGDLGEAQAPPKRDLPESASLADVEAAVDKAYSPTSTRPLKPILKEPHFELAKEPEETGAAAAVAATTAPPADTAVPSSTSGFVHDAVTVDADPTAISDSKPAVKEVEEAYDDLSPMTTSRITS